MKLRTRKEMAAIVFFFFSNRNVSSDAYVIDDDVSTLQ